MSLYYSERITAHVMRKDVHGCWHSICRSAVSVPPMRNRNPVSARGPIFIFGERRPDKWCHWCISQARNDVRALSEMFTNRKEEQ